MTGEHTTTITILVHVRPTSLIKPAQSSATDWLASFSIGGVEYCEHGKTGEAAVAELEETINARQRNRLAQIEKARRG